MTRPIKVALSAPKAAAPPRTDYVLYTGERPRVEIITIEVVMPIGDGSEYDIENSITSAVDELCSWGHARVLKRELCLDTFDTACKVLAHRAGDKT